MDAVTKKHLKNGDPAVYFSFMTMLQHIGWFLSRIS